MNAEILAALMALMAIAGAILLLPLQAVTSKHVRAFVLWGVVGLAYFLIKSPEIVYVLLALLVVMLMPAGANKKVALYIAIGALLPFSYLWQVPFPFVNFLIVLFPTKAVALLLLVPAVIAAWRSEGIGSLPVVLLALFSLYSSLLISGEFSPTATIRFAVDQLLVYAVPYAAILCAVRNEEDVNNCIDAFIVASVILAGISLLSTLRQWNFYNINFYTDERGGFIRVTGTANNHTLGMHLAGGLLLLESVRRRWGIGGMRLWMLRLTMLASLFFTGSRGAQAAYIVGMGMYIGLVAESQALRRLLLFSMGAGFVAACVWLIFGEVSRIDETGNFAYRQELLRTAVAYLSEHILFGDYNFARSGRFDHLVNGQNIIDITNFYLQIALTFGLIGFVMVFLPFLATARNLLASVAKGSAGMGQNLWRNQIGLLGTIVAWLVVVATTSDTGITVHLGIVFCALGHAAVLVSRSQVVAVPAADDEPVAASHALPAAR